MHRRQFLAATATGFPALIRSRSGAASDRPNILWILGDDLGAELSCYGYPFVHTPNMDRLATQGTRFTQFHTTAPVCSASRSGFNVGLYQTTTNTQNHRSHRKDGYQLPENARLITDRLREQGYFTCNVREFADGLGGMGKTDYNFKADKPSMGRIGTSASPVSHFTPRSISRLHIKATPSERRANRRSSSIPRESSCRPTIRTTRSCGTKSQTIWTPFSFSIPK